MSERDLFIAAVQITDPAERSRWLDRECGSDAALRQRIEVLLRALHQAGSLLENPAVAPEANGGQTGQGEPASDASGEPAAEAPGTFIGGRYKLLEQIGEGGMGAVWMAQQTEPVRRLVAVKLIKPGMASKQVLARFEVERQALALMDHPNIAKVHDAGATPDGRPFFVMELVKGVPITRYCDEHRLTPRQRLELFVPVCQAIQHAHQKGIIHRDLKPSNVLVALYDDRPVPKVIDFGVAKATGQQLTEQTLNTGFGAVLGTVEYMSPEQASFNQLDVDTRSDIYSLGVLLYELLAGSPPFTQNDVAKAGLMEMLRVIREQEPSKPSTKLSTAVGLPTLAANRGIEPAKLTKLVRGELDWIVMKALEKDRNRRYETANGFALDVQRYLADEPVQACPPSAGYRLRKLARRNRTGLAVAGLILSFLVLLGSGAGWALRDRESREQDLARKAERDLALTEQSVRQAVEQAIKIRGELHALLTKPGGVQELLNQPGRWNFLILSAQSELAQARRSAARAGESLGAELTQALHKLEEQLTGDEVNRLLALRLEKIRLDRSTWVEGRFDNREAAAEYPQALARFAVLEEDAAAVAARLRSTAIHEQLVAALDDWALVALLLRNDTVAERLLAVARQAAPDPAWADRLRRLESWRDQKALAKLVEEAPAARLTPQMLALVGDLLSRRSSNRESWLRRAHVQYPADFWLNFGLANALQETQPVEAIGFYRVALAVRPTSSATYNNLGNALHLQRKLPEAIAAYHKAIEIDPRFAYGYNNLGLALRDQKKLPEAIAAYHKALVIDSQDAKAWYNLGNAHRDQKKLPEAIAAYHKAIHIEPNYAKAHYYLGKSLYDQKKLPEAIAAYLKAIEIDLECADAHNNLGNALRLQGKLPEAVAAFHKAIEIDPKFTSAYNNLGLALRDQEKLPEAIATYQKAIEINPKYASAYVNFGNAVRLQRNLPEAVTAFHKAIEIDPKHAGAYTGLGNALCDQKKLPEAVAAFHKAIEIDPQFAFAYNNLGLALHDQKKLPEAVAAFHKAIEIDPQFAFAYNNLGRSLRNQKKLPEAVAAHHKAIELMPSFANAHCHLGLALRDLGQFAQALNAFQLGHKLSTKRLDWNNPSARWVAECERLVQLEARLPAILKGEAKPSDMAEQLEFARVCTLKRLSAAAARFYQEALTAKPELTGQRYAAARAAALAGCGTGDDAAKLDDTERARWRQQALDWLKADLGHWKKQLNGSEPKARAAAQQALKNWLGQSDLAGLRDEKALGQLPEEQRQAWRRLWAEVASALDGAPNESRPSAAH